MKAFKFVLLLLLCGLIFSSCKKYEDGPMISLMPKKYRLCNSWKLDYYVLDGNTIDPYGSQNSKWFLAFHLDGDFSLEIDQQYTDGEWSFSEDKEKVSLKYYDDFGSGPILVTDAYTIKRLKSKELVLGKFQGGTLTYYYVPRY